MIKKYVIPLSVLFFILIIAPSDIFPQVSLSDESPKSEAVILDEEYEDWAGVEDIANISGSGNTTIKAQNHSGFLFLYFEVEDIIELQRDDRMVMYIDTDNDSGTGFSVNGIGADVKFDFGSRSGTVYLNGNQYSIGPRALFMVISPTVWSDRFEISIDRDAQFGGSDLFISEEIKILFKDKITGTFSPSESGGASYTFAGTSAPELTSYSIKNPNDSLIRFMTHNVLMDNLFNTNDTSSFRRMYQTILPDVIGFQEIYNHSADETATLVEEFIPSGGDENWYSAKVGDNIIVSRYAVKGEHSIGQNGAFLLDLRPDYNTDVLVLNAHTPCCDNDQSRQEEIDALMAFVRDAKNGTGELTISEDTPILIMGDMNVVGDPQNIETLLTGDIVNENTYGNDFTPGWNGNDFTDSKPLTSGLPMTFTRWSESGAGNYSNGRLDMIVYSSSVMSLENSYVMYTNSILQDTLDQYPMQRADSEKASDHLPLVADFSITSEQEGITLYNLRSNDNEGVPDYINQTVTVSGIVTADEKFGNNLAYMQNEYAGIAIYASEFGSEFTKGDSITITADVDQYNGLTQLAYNSQTSGVTVHGSTDVPKPEKVTISEVLNQDWNGYEMLEGKLAVIEHVKFVESGDFTGNEVYKVTGGEDTLALYINSNTNLEGTAIPEEKVNVTGVIGQFDKTKPYSESYQMIPRDTSDIEKYEPLKGILRLRKNGAQGWPVLNDSLVSVSGVVTLSDEFASSGPGFMQDNYAGVALYSKEIVSALNTGDSITITSPVGFYKGLTELVYDSEKTEITVHKTVELPEPRVVSLSDVINQEWNNVEKLEGSLVKIEDVEIIEDGNFEGGNYTITDGSNKLQLRVEDGTGIQGNNIPSGSGSVVGLLSQYDSQSPYGENYQILPRTKADLNFGQMASSLEMKNQLKNQVFNGGDTLTIDWEVENVNHIDLFYKFWEDEDWTLISDNVLASELSYNWVVPQEVEDSCMIKLANSENSYMYDLSGRFYVKNSESVTIGNTSENVPGGVDVFPNPFENKLIVEFSLSEKVPLVIDLFKQNGEKVKTYKFSAIEAGNNRLVLNANDISAGIYFFRIKAIDEFVGTHRIVKIRQRL